MAGKILGRIVANRIEDLSEGAVRFSERFPEGGDESQCITGHRGHREYRHRK